MQAKHRQRIGELEAKIYVTENVLQLAIEEPQSLTEEREDKLAEKSQVHEVVNAVKPEECCNELPSKVSRTTAAEKTGSQMEIDTEKKTCEYEELVQHLHGIVARTDAELRAAA